MLVHGETISEPVCPGTNMAAIEAGVDILAHPGLISAAEVKLAAKKSIFLEITSRRGSCLTNGLVTSLARKFGASLVVNSDTHAPNDLLTTEKYHQVALGAGLSETEIKTIRKNSQALVKKVLK